MKYKFFYSLSFFSLYGSSGYYLIALWRSSLTEAFICLLSSFIFYKLTANWIYYAKDWIKASIVTYLLLFACILFETPFISYAIAISYLSATFIQVYLDEMCRSKEE
ncbi:MAG: hypothetical protein FJZ59_02695 [Chlamydiae bacterium]|jgi:hypothetical protein|nr:hypothetical protein [Chlamydiota bacterium]